MLKLDPSSHRGLDDSRIAKLLREAAEPIASIERPELGALLDRIGNSRLVLIGEASHGTSEFYRMRARITRELVEQKGFNIVAVEADWPDAARVVHYVRHRPQPEGRDKAFTRFPTWMWRNREVADFAEWLREYNGRLPRSEDGAGFFGLDLYSLSTSINAVVKAELFPAEVRTLGVALPYALANTIFGGTAERRKPWSGSAPRLVMCSTIGMPAASRIEWTGRARALVSSIL